MVIAVTVLFSIVTVILMSRVDIDNAIQFHEDLRDLYDFLHGAPLAEPSK
ncbi:TPA_asm: hypothetical protein [ssRNA phage SRR7976323_2]|uniref:Uncharacterized protein n=1 Tax=ssRNA phage SRR7976323_2 TaxID=2786689 RepID=A0A8S5L5L7_9VIRU|nr:hypothetical protein QIK99_gp3 [ssRNA phage SRR7976323_2]DAD52735.1 TPA_asm: hypothetical protein [ssRNA phage SRR7976323_2]